MDIYLLKNKICGSVLMVLGSVTILIGKDLTGFIFSAILGVPLLFSRKNWIF